MVLMGEAVFIYVLFSDTLDGLYEEVSLWFHYILDIL